MSDSALWAYLAAELSATIAVREQDPRAVAARELMDEIHAARTGDASAIRWIAESPMWEILHHVIGEPEMAERRRREILTRIVAEAGAATAADVAAKLEAYLQAWMTLRSVSAVARHFGVSRVTARRWIASALAGKAPRGRGRPARSEAAVTADAPQGARAA